MTADQPKSAAMTTEELVDFYGFDLEQPTREEIAAARAYREQAMKAMENSEGEAGK